MGLRTVIFGCRKTCFESLQYLQKNGRHKIVGLVSQDFQDKVNDGVTCSHFSEWATAAGVPFWEADKLSETQLSEKLRVLKPQAGLSIGWRRLLHEPFVSLPSKGFYNFHTSDLPRYRGFASTSWAILNGDPATAITAHRMIAGRADEGDIYLKKKIRIMKTTTIGSLFQEIERLLPPMVLELLDGLERKTLKPKPQEAKKVVLSLPRYPVDGWIDWSKSAVEIDRLVRSVSKPYPGAFTSWRMKKLWIWEGGVSSQNKKYAGVPGHVIGSEDGKSILILTGKGIYQAKDVQIEGGEQSVPPAQLVKGTQQRLGLGAGEMFEMLKQKEPAGCVY